MTFNNKIKKIDKDNLSIPLNTRIVGRSNLDLVSEASKVNSDQSIFVRQSAKEIQYYISNQFVEKIFDSLRAQIEAQGESLDAKIETLI